MAEYIRRDYAIDAALDVYYDTPDIDLSGEKFEAAILKIPAADVAPVVHGRWVLLDECYNEGVYCSACHKKVYKKCYANQKIKSKFCPHCGAKMDGGAENG